MHTNSTPNLELSQFISTDKPTWLGDVNGDMLKIDTAYAAVGAVASGASSKADTAISTAEAASTTATDAATLANTANTNAQSALTTAGNAATAANAAGELAQTASGKADTADGKADANATNIGDLTALTTTAKTSLVAAINEVDAKPAGATDADDVTYDNTTSGLSATNVQDALDELAQGGASGEYVEVTADGVKTLSQLLYELYGLIDSTKINARSVFVNMKVSGDNETAPINLYASGGYKFTYSAIVGTAAYIASWNVNSVESACKTSTATIQQSGTSITSAGSEVTTSGNKFRIYY